MAESLILTPTERRPMDLALTCKHPTEGTQPAPVRGLSLAFTWITATWCGYDLRAVSPSICTSVTTHDITQNQVRIQVPKTEAGHAVRALACGERGVHVWCQAQQNICDWQCLRGFSIAVVHRPRASAA